MERRTNGIPAFADMTIVEMAGQGGKTLLSRRRRLPCASLRAMKTLTLIRHAMSSQDFPLLGDFQRPLNPRGRRDVPLMAQRLAASMAGPVTLVSSPATRALTTAQGFAEAFAVDDADIHLEPGIYEASAGTLLALINELDDAAEQVLMFGHNPGFTELARVLSTGTLPFVEMAPCACLTFAFREATRWSDVLPGSGTATGWLAP